MNEDLNKKMNTLIYFLTKEAARSSFVEFLEHCDISEDEYELIKKEWEKIGMTGVYI